MTKQELRDLVESSDARTLTKLIEQGHRYDVDIPQLKKKANKTRVFVITSISAVLLLIIALMIVLPRYNVYSSEMRGKAESVRAEQNRRIQIEEAKANVESALLDAEADSVRAVGQMNAEIIRAEGMAQAMDIENGKLTDSYIKYLWVRNIDKGDKIYIPTEAGMPLLEARN